ncbi:hypothetical protein SFRURICE_020115 [Spodoptera frugiperda]|nr:hypothetical protein SFRURICE_020115 [Spodoptera frugiperda]
MTFTLGLNMRLISSLCFGEEFRCSANSLCINKGLHLKINQLHYGTTVRQWSKTLILRHWISRAVQLHGMHNDQNLTPVDFLHEVPFLYRRNWPCIVILLRNRFEDNYKIKRIFSPRVNVIGIRKCVRACMRRREDHFEQNFAN